MLELEEMVIMLQVFFKTIIFEKNCTHFASTDVPRLRHIDICFALTAVLNSLWPSGAKALQITAPKTAGDIRAGSLTFTARDSKMLTKVSLTLYQVAFLGRCFSNNKSVTQF